MNYVGALRIIRLTLFPLLVSIFAARIWHFEHGGARRLSDWFVAVVMFALLTVNEVIRYAGNRQRPRTNDQRPT